MSSFCLFTVHFFVIFVSWVSTILVNNNFSFRLKAIKCEESESHLRATQHRINTQFVAYVVWNVLLKITLQFFSTHFSHIPSSTSKKFRSKKKKHLVINNCNIFHPCMLLIRQCVVFFLFFSFSLFFLSKNHVFICPNTHPLVICVRCKNTRIQLCFSLIFGQFSPFLFDLIFVRWCVFPYFVCAFYCACLVILKKKTECTDH